MTRDPLWRAIKERLGGPLDPACFERCMQDIFRDLYPNLAPVVGGSDSGMDGSFGTSEGPFPLICTTSEDVLGNFRNSATNHLVRRGGPARCVVATSQHLTPQRRDNILDEAKAIGIVVVQIHDREDLVGRLYRSPRWRNELLGIPGNPPALSCYPPRVRESDPLLLVGREEDVAWLHSTPGDLLLIGQPGSGKTHLHQYLAAKEECLFLVCDDETAIADAVRAQAPKVIVVDDAHIHLGRIDALRRIRKDIGAEYVIHANCWIGYEREVKERLQIDPGSIRHLELLVQRKIKELIEQLGIHGPDQLLHLIIQQSEGRPGLTAALVNACKRGNVESVWSGDALADALLHGRGLARDETDRVVLAAFAIGGDHGMSTNVVADQLGLTPLDIRARLASLADGGIISEFADGYGEQNILEVRPAALRAVLVRNVFFEGVAKPDFRLFAQAARSGGSAMHVLLDAMQRGANVPLDYVLNEIVSRGSKSLWEHFSWVSKRSCRTILNEYPDQVLNCAAGLLYFEPERALNELLRRAILSGKNPEDSKEAAEALRRWVGVRQELDQSSRRREKIINALEAVAKASASVDPSGFSDCVEAIIHPSFSSHETPPGEPLTVQFWRGLVPIDCLRQIAASWPRLLALAAQLPVIAWPKLLEGVRGWLWPSQHNMHPIPKDVYDFMVSNGGKMLESLATLPACTRVARSQIANMAKAARLDIRVNQDPLLKLIFGEPMRGEDWQTRSQRRTSAYGLLADGMLPNGSESVIAELARIEREIKEFGTVHNGHDRWILCAELAQKCADPEKWLEKAVEASLPSQMVLPFFRSTVQKHPSLTVSWIQRLFSVGEYRQIAVREILETPGLDSGIRQLVHTSLPDSEQIDEMYFAGYRVVAEMMAELLQHKNASVRSAAALALWYQSTQGQVDVSGFANWRETIIEMDGTHRQNYWLGEIFKKHPSLAFPWALKKLEKESLHLWENGPGIREAAKALSKDERRTVLRSLRNREKFDDDWVDALIGMDFELYREWLQEAAEEHLRLMPLHRNLDERWVGLVRVALDEGVTPEDVIRYVQFQGSSSGLRSLYYKGVAAFFDGLRQDSDERLRTIAERGARRALDLATAEEKSERREAVYGR